MKIGYRKSQISQYLSSVDQYRDFWGSHTHYRGNHLGMCTCMCPPRFGRVHPAGRDWDHTNPSLPEMIEITNGRLQEHRLAFPVTAPIFPVLILHLNNKLWTERKITFILMEYLEKLSGFFLMNEESDLGVSSLTFCSPLMNPCFLILHRMYNWLSG